MRLWHLVVIILVLSVVLSMTRDPVGRVAVVVFLTGLGEIAMGTTALLALFQTLGALGEAKGLSAHAEAMAATAVVLGVATATMTGWLWVGLWLVQASVA
ncbi:hypothetical protein ACYOEI_06100 [Singulisphaera rosea]